MKARKKPLGTGPRAGLLGAALAGALVAAACDPITVDHVVPRAMPPGPVADGGSGGGGSPFVPEDPGTGSVDAGSPPPVPVSVRTDVTLPPWSTCEDGWQSRELAQGVVYTAFTLDREGEGLYAYQREGVLKVGNTAAPSWLEAPGWVGAPHTVGLEVDAQGALHLVYDGTDFDLDPLTPPTVYAASTVGGTWSRRAVGPGVAMAFDLDTEGVTHLLFRREELGGELFYANDRGGTWTIEDLGLAVGFGAAMLRVDAKGHAHGVYRTKEGSRLRYLTNASGAWVHEEIASLGYGPALALDADGVPHVTYTDQDLWYAVRREGTWERTRISERADYTSALAVDAAGVVHVAGTDGARKRLFYATNVSGSWKQVTVAPLVTPYQVEYSGERFVELDPQGRVHIAWFYGVYTDGDGNRDTRFRYARQCP